MIENELGNSIDQKKSTLLDDDLELTSGISNNYSVEVERLQVENRMLKDHFGSLNKLIDHVLDQKNSGAAINFGEKATVSQSSQVSHSPQSNKPPQRKKSKGSHSGNTNKKVNNNNGHNVNKLGKDCNNKKTIIIGDSHVKRLHNQQIPNTKANGIGGLQSYQLISRQASFVNKEIDSVDELIIHAGCNDIKSRCPKAIVNSIEAAAKHYLNRNTNLHISISSIFLRKDDTTLNAKIVETNSALKALCLAQGLDFIDHGNIAFRHLSHDGLHLSPDGIQLFAKNINSHITFG